MIQTKAYFINNNFMAKTSSVPLWSSKFDVDEGDYDEKSVVSLSPENLKELYAFQGDRS